MTLQRKKYLSVAYVMLSDVVPILSLAVVHIGPPAFEALETLFFAQSQRGSTDLHRRVYAGWILADG